MAKNLNPRQLRFITEYMQTSNAARSYMLAGYQVTTRNALDAASSRLLGHVKVKAEINRRQRAMIKRADVTLDKLLQDLADDRELARRLDQPSAAIAATQLTAKLCGHLIERKESGGPGDFATAKTEAEVIDQVRAELGDKAASLLQAMVSDAAEPDIAMPAASTALN